jgi:iron complex transport system ATP-binding protein
VSLAVENISAGYDNVPVLKNVSLKIERGSICALMGRNGSGKTTMLRCINAILKPTQGRIQAHGRDVGGLSRIELARLISLVPQGVEILEEVGVPALAARPFNHLSGGERQLIMLARALFQNAPIMLLDEPNSHLDFSNQHRMMTLMRNMVKKRGLTALISLHDPNLALHYCDQVVMLKDGHVIAQGPTEDVMKNDTLRHVLGENIQLDRTINGFRVVTPRTSDLPR